MNKPVILCADDEEKVLSSLKEQLRTEFNDFDVEIAESGEEALEIFDELNHESIPVPVVISDEFMPGMKGHELLIHIHQRSPSSTNILLTGHADTFAVARAVNEARLYRYIGKPWEQTDLLLTVSEAARRHFQDKELDKTNEELVALNRELELRVQLRTAQLELEKMRGDRLANFVIPAGISLNNLENHDELLKEILTHARELCNCDGGILFLKTPDQQLAFVAMHFDSLGMVRGGTDGTPIKRPPLPLNHKDYPSAAALVAQKGVTLNIKDALNGHGVDLRFCQKFDSEFTYQTRSLLVVPLKDRSGKVNGVLQLVNSRDQHTGKTIAFDDSMQQHIELISQLAGAALQDYARKAALQEKIGAMLQIDDVKKNQEVKKILESPVFGWLNQ